MSHLNDPPWKVKTRPCPFYTRGNCLFSASCNFIHAVKSPVAPEVRVTEASVSAGVRRSNSRSVFTLKDNNHGTASHNKEHGYADRPNTPPNAMSPEFSDDTPPFPVVDGYAPQPSIWGSGRRRYSWAPSIRSISSAGSNLTYPTDLSPTASYVSEIDDVEDGDDEVERLDPADLVAAYGLPSANNPNDTFEFIRSRPVSNAVVSVHARSQSVTNDTDPYPVRPERESQSTINAAIVSAGQKQRVREYQSTKGAIAFRLPEDDDAVEEVKVFTPASAISDPDAQVLDVKSPAPLGEAFVLRSPKPRRTKSSKAASFHHDDDDGDYDHVDADLGVEDPTVQLTNPSPSPPRAESPAQETLEEMFLRDRGTSSSSSRPRDRQMTLNEVFLNLQDPSLRPRRIDRIMQGLSPERPINSVLPSIASVTETETETIQKPAPFHGRGDRKDTAFREHLASLMAVRSAQLSDPDWEKKQHRRKRILEDAPESAPANSTQFGIGASQRQQTLPPLPESAAPRMKMFDVISPDGVNPAFTRPKRPGHRKRTAGAQGTPATSGSTTGFIPTPTRGSPSPGASPALPEKLPPLPPSASLTYLPPLSTSASPQPGASPQLSPRVVEEPPKLSPPPPSTPQRRRRRPSPSPGGEDDGGSDRPARLGSLTGTPVHDSPEDFRGMKKRDYFTPLEDDDARAAMDVVGGYEEPPLVVVIQERRASSRKVTVDRDDVPPMRSELEVRAESDSERSSAASKDRGGSLGLGRPPPSSRRRTSKSTRSSASSSAAPSTEHTIRNVSKNVPARTASRKSSRAVSGQKGRVDSLLLAPEEAGPAGDNRDFTPRAPRAGTSREDGITPKAKGAAGSHSRGNSAEKNRAEDDVDAVSPVPQLLPAAEMPLSPKFQPRPLRLSRLFEQAHSTTPQTLPEPRSARTGAVTPNSARSRQGRRPLSAIFINEQDEHIDSTTPESHQHIPPSPTPRRPHQQATSPFPALQSPAFSHTPPGSAGYPLTSTPQTTALSTRIRSDSILEEPDSHQQHSTLSSPFVFPAPSSARQGRFDNSPLRSPASSVRSRQSRAANLPYHHNTGFVPKHLPRSSVSTPITSTSAKAPAPPKQQQQQLAVRHGRNLSVESAVSASSAASNVPKPLLFWAIAADDVREVERLLSSAEANANDRAGPDDLPALLFTMGNEGLKHKNEIIKTLLAYGADPSVLQQFNNGHANRPSTASHPSTDSKSSTDDDGADDRRTSVMTVRPNERSQSSSPVPRRNSRQITMGMNPEIDYYLTRVTEMPEKQLDALRKAGFDPLARMPFRMIGQDLVLQELLRVLARHSARGSSSPVSIIFAGPSGHGKSFLSRSIGELLRIPAHTVNMTNLRTQDEFLQAQSLTSKNGDVSLAAFLAGNEGKRCAVILEEIEKVADKSASNTLLMPWELGKLNTTARQYDTSHVIWISTSNAGEEIVFDFEHNRGDRPCDRKEYLDLATRIRRKLIESLGASLVSRITTVLPFLAFTHPEKLALAYHCLPSDSSLSKEELDTLLEDILADYIPNEGVRSIQRAVQRHCEDDMW